MDRIFLRPSRVAGVTVAEKSAYSEVRMCALNARKEPNIEGANRGYRLAWSLTEVPKNAVGAVCTAGPTH